MASMMSSLQQPTSLISSNSLITFGGKQVKHKSNKVTPQDLDSSAINDCGLPTNSSPVPEKSEQTYQKKNYSKSSSQNIYANQKAIKVGLVMSCSMSLYKFYNEIDIKN